MDDDLMKKLDALAEAPIVTRKVSLEKTEECPVWSPVDQYWIESDDNLRKRLKAMMIGVVE